MRVLEDKDTRYFIEIELKTLKVVSTGHEQKQCLNKGRQDVLGRHRLFVTKGQYNKFIERISVGDFQ